MKVKLYKLLIRHYEKTREQAPERMREVIDGYLVRPREGGQHKAITKRENKRAKRRAIVRHIATLTHQEALAYMKAQKPRLIPNNVIRWPEWRELGLEYPGVRKRVSYETYRVSLSVSDREREGQGQEVPPRPSVYDLPPEWETL